MNEYLDQHNILESRQKYKVKLMDQQKYCLILGKRQHIILSNNLQKYLMYIYLYTLLKHYLQTPLLNTANGIILKYWIQNKEVDQLGIK